jgi:hypothetical protein
LDFNYLEAKLAATDTNALIADYDYLPEDKDLRLVQSAIRLSANVLAGDERLKLRSRCRARRYLQMDPRHLSLLENSPTVKRKFLSGRTKKRQKNT